MDTGKVAHADPRGKERGLLPHPSLPPSRTSTTNPTSVSVSCSPQFQTLRNFTLNPTSTTRV